MWNWINKVALKITWLDINSKIVNLRYGDEFKGVGKVIDLNINFKENMLNCILKLNGETENTTLSATGLNLLKDNDLYYIKFASAQVNREWMNTIVNKLVVDNRFEIKEDVYKKLTGLLGK